MQDKCGSAIKIGDLIRIDTDLYSNSAHNYWVIKGFIDFSVSVDVVVENFTTKDVIFICIHDVKKLT